MKKKNTDKKVLVEQVSFKRVGNEVIAYANGEKVKPYEGLGDFYFLVASFEFTIGDGFEFHGEWRQVEGESEKKFVLKNVVLLQDGSYLIPEKVKALAILLGLNYEENSKK